MNNYLWLAAGVAIILLYVVQPDWKSLLATVKGKLAQVELPSRGSGKLADRVQELIEIRCECADDKEAEDAVNSLILTLIDREADRAKAAA